MRTQIWAIGLILAVLACSGGAFAQAAAEAALTHGVAAGASTGLGSAFGKMENQLAGRLGQQVSTTTAPRQAVTVIRPGVQKSAKAAHVTAARTAAPAPNGSLIASIQGGEQAPACVPAAAPDPQTTPTPAAQKPGDCAVPSPDANQYQSVIDLPAAK